MKLSKAKIFLLFLGLVLTVGLLSACNTILPFDTTAAVTTTALATTTANDALLPGGVAGVPGENGDVPSSPSVTNPPVSEEPIEPTPAEEFIFELLPDGTYQITKYIGSRQAVSIPAEYNEKPVTAIGKEAFSEDNIDSSIMHGIRKIVFPDSITAIGESAFEKCFLLENITFGNGLVSVGEWAFAYCYSLESLVIPDTVTTVGASAFAGCLGLTNATIGSHVTEIGENAFFQCPKLLEVYNKSSLTILPNCWTGEKGVSYPLNVYTPTSGASKLHTRNEYRFYEDGETVFLLSYIGSDEILVLPNQYDGKSYAIASYAFFLNVNLRSVVIPEGVTSIGDSAFCTNPFLLSISIPESVTSIGDSAFSMCSSIVEVYDCSSLTFGVGNRYNLHALNIYTPTSGESKLHTVGDYIFYEDGETVYLVAYTGTDTSITLPDYKGKEYAPYRFPFGNNSPVKSVTVPSCVTSISFGFDLCPMLESVYIADLQAWCEMKQIDDKVFCNKKYRVYFDGRPLEGGTLVIPEGTTSIAPNAFSGCTGITGVIIPNSVTTIGSYAFEDCTGLESITIPDSVTGIGYRAFYGCTGLEEIVFNDTTYWYYYGSLIDVSNPVRNLSFIWDSLYKKDVIESPPVTTGPAPVTTGPVPVTTAPVTTAPVTTGPVTTGPVTPPVTTAPSAGGDTAGQEFMKFPDKTYTYNGISRKATVQSVPAYLRVTYTYKDSAGNVIGNDEAVNAGTYTVTATFAFVRDEDGDTYALPEPMTATLTIEKVETSKLTGFDMVNYTGYYYEGCKHTTALSGKIPTGVTVSYTMKQIMDETGATVDVNITASQDGKFYATEIGVYEMTATFTDLYGNYDAPIPPKTCLITIKPPTPLEEFTFELLDDDTYKITGYIGESEDIFIPFEYNEKAVTAIGSSVFANCTGLTSVTIGGGVTSIGYEAFAGCSDLESITFLDTHTWYRTTGYSNWQNKTGGTAIGVADPEQNATYFTDTYRTYYWYKN